MLTYDEIITAETEAAWSEYDSAKAKAKAEADLDEMIEAALIA